MMDPERPVEQILRSAAEKRRAEAGPPFEMHPATRKLLRAEAGRVFKQERPEARRQWSPLLFWPRFAGVAVLVVVLGFFFWVNWPDTNGSRALMDLAKTAPEPAEVGYDHVELKNKSAPELVDSEKVGGQIGPVPSRSEELEAPRLSLKPEQPSAPAPTLASSSERRTVELRLNMEETRSKGTPILPSSLGLSTAGEPASAATEMSLADRVEAITPDASSVLREAARESGQPAVQPPGAKTYALSESATILTNSSGVAGSGADALGHFELSNQANKDSLPAVSQLANERYRRTVIAGTEPARKQVFHNLAFKTPSARQQFTRPTPASTREQPTPLGDQGQALLSSFSVEQTGRELRVFDNDGSVYAGRMQVTNEQALGAAQWVANSDGPVQMAQSNAIANDKQTSALPQFYYFHVTGTNRTLNQKVEFIGNLVQNAAPTDFSNQWNYGTAGGALQNQTGPVYQNQAGQAVISGKLVVGGRQEVNIDALSAAP